LIWIWPLTKQINSNLAGRQDITSRMSFNESKLIESKNATTSASSTTGVWEDSLTSRGGLAPTAGLYSTTPRIKSESKSNRMAARCCLCVDLPPGCRSNQDFAYWDCAHALPKAQEAQGRSPQFWLGSILKYPERDQREPEALLQSLSANSFVSYAPWIGRPSIREWILHFRLGLIKK
jgi:hypothetical protein